jgi:hypothetical protein
VVILAGEPHNFEENSYEEGTSFHELGGK